MKFFTNRILTDKAGKSFGDIVKAAKSKGTIKTASTEAPIQEEAEKCLTPAQETLPDALKEKIKKSKGCKENESTESKSDKKESETKEEKEASKEEEIKIASDEEKKRTDVHHSEGTKMQQSNGENGKPEDCSAAKPAEKEAKSAKVEKKAESEDKKRSDVHDCECTEGQKSKGTNGQPEGDKKEAKTTDRKFVRIANLTSKQKAFLKNYYKMYYPAEYADALTADK